MINKLSKEQEAAIPGHVAEWIKRGLSTESNDDEIMEKTRNFIAAFPTAWAKEPEILIVDSPLSLKKAYKKITGKSDYYVLNSALWWGRPALGFYAWSEYYIKNFDFEVKKDDIKYKADLELCQATYFSCFFEKVVFVCRAPQIVNLENQRRLHCADGGALVFRDGFSIYAWHGVVVPRDLILKPENITVEMIDGEKNQEIKRVMIDRYDELRHKGAYIVDSGAKVIAQDDFGKLYKKDINGDSILFVKVKNSTPEPDGSIKDYYLQVHPECRPLLAPDASGAPQYGDAQELTARNAVASTFGLRGEEYALEIET